MNFQSAMRDALWTHPVAMTVIKKHQNKRAFEHQGGNENYIFFFLSKKKIMISTLSKNLILLLMVGIVFSISLAFNTFFTQIRDRYLHFSHQILASIIYLIFLVSLLAIVTFIYTKLNRTSIDFQKLVT